MSRDFIQALRQFRRRPASTLIAIGTFAIGVAISTALLNALDLVMSRPLPVRDVERLVQITSRPLGGGLDDELYLSLSKARSFDAVTASRLFRERVTIEQHAEVLFGEFIAENYFRALGVSPRLGSIQSFDPSVVDRAVVISHSLWKERFAGSGRAIGRPITIGEKRYVIVGVAPPTFRGVEEPKLLRVEVWIPTSTGFQSSSGDGPGARRWHVVARLRADASSTEASAEVRTIAGGVLASRSEPTRATGYTVRHLAEILVSPNVDQQVRILLLAVAAVAGTVLLIAAINLSHLFLVSTMARRRDLATMVSLGAPARRILRLLLTEYLLTALVAACLGTIGAYWLLTIVIAAAPAMAAYSRLPLEVNLDWRFWFIGLVSAVAVSIPAAAIPVITHVRRESGVRWHSANAIFRPTFGLRNLAIIPQLALCIAMVGLGNAMAQRVLELEARQPRFHHSGRVVVGFDWSLQRSSVTAKEDFLSRLGEHLGSRYGNSSWSYSSSLPIYAPFTPAYSVGVLLDGAAQSSSRPFSSKTTIVGPNYFAVLGLPILQGRDFSAADVRWSARVGLVSLSTAQRFWPGRSPLGQKLFVAAPGDTRSRSKADAENGAVTVVGVVPDLNRANRDPEVYLALAQNSPSRVFALVRTPGDSGRTLSELREAVHQLDRDVAITEASTLTEMFQERTYLTRLIATSLRVFAVVAFVLSWMGLYAVMSFLLLARTREFGVRLSLGATVGAVKKLLLQESMAVILPGVLLGVVGAYGAARVSGVLTAASQLRAADGIGRHVSTDWALILLQSLMLGTACVVAALSVARQVATIDPVRALRSE